VQSFDGHLQLNHIFEIVTVGNIEPILEHRIQRERSALLGIRTGIAFLVTAFLAEVTFL
jgi:hypothetical protein